MNSGFNIPMASFRETAGVIARQLNRQKEQARSTGQLAKEIEKQIDEGAERVKEMAREADSRYQEAMAQVDYAREKAEKARSGALPEDVKASLEARGVDPESNMKYSREEVVERHGLGKSFAGAVLKGLDLSRLDLKGIDLSGAQCRKTEFFQFSSSINNVLRRKREWCEFFRCRHE